jgi:hypothetical protein
MTKHKRKRASVIPLGPNCRFHHDGDDVFVVHGTERVAKRIKSDAPQAWVSLVPGYTVTGSNLAVVVAFDPDAARHH